MAPMPNPFELLSGHYGSCDIAAIATAAAAPPPPEKKVEREVKMESAPSGNVHAPDGEQVVDDEGFTRIKRRVATSRDGSSGDGASRHGDGSFRDRDSQGHVAQRYDGGRGLGHGGYRGRGRGYNGGDSRGSHHQVVALMKIILQEVNNGGSDHQVDGVAEQQERADENGMKGKKSGGSDHQLGGAEQKKEALESGMKKETNGGVYRQYHYSRGGGGYRGRGRGYYYSIGRGGAVEQENQTVSGNGQEEVGGDNNGGPGVYNQYGHGRRGGDYYRGGGRGYNGGRRGRGYYYNPRVFDQGRDTEVVVQQKEAVVEENRSNGNGGYSRYGGGEFRGGYQGRGYGRGGEGRVYNRHHEGDASLEEQEKAADGAKPNSNGNGLQEKYGAQERYKKKNMNGSKRRKAYKQNKKKREAAGNLSADDDSSEKKAEDASVEKAVSVASSKTSPEDPEEKNKTLAEYEKELEEKRKELQTSKPEVRKVESNDQFDGMEVVRKKKKEEEELFIKLKSDKEKLKIRHEDEEKAKEAPKPMKITEFLKDYKGGYNGDRGRRDGGEGRRGGYNGGRPQKGTISGKADAPVIAMEDPAQFPELKAPPSVF